MPTLGNVPQKRRSFGCPQLLHQLNIVMRQAAATIRGKVNVAYTEAAQCQSYGDNNEKLRKILNSNDEHDAVTNDAVTDTDNQEWRGMSAGWGGRGLKNSPLVKQADIRQNLCIALDDNFTAVSGGYERSLLTPTDLSERPAARVSLHVQL